MPIVAAAIFLHSGTTQLMHGVRSLHGVQPVTLVVAAALSVLSMLISGVLWSCLLRCLGHRLPLHVGLAAYLAAGLAGYALNMVGSAAGSALLLGHYGLSRQRAALQLLLANALGFCGMFLWAPMGLFALGRAGAIAGAAVAPGPHGVATVGTLLALFAAMLLALKAFTALLSSDNALVRRLKGAQVCPTRSNIRVRSLLVPLSLSATSWLVGALALYALLDALGPRASLSPGPVIGSLALANILSSMAFFLPAGIGVRDGALVTLLMHSTGLPVAECAAAALAIRALDLGIKMVLMFVVLVSIAIRRAAMGVSHPTDLASA
jgi:uncharacterized membrane protein YbhN (UPF0104 family)